MKSYFIEKFIRLFYPALCESCPQSLKSDQRFLCAACRTALQAVTWPLDQTYFDESIEHLGHAWAVFMYEPPFREILRRVKYYRKEYLLRVFTEPAIKLAQAITTEWTYDTILPIPISHRKYLERHFNQTETLAEILNPHIRPPICRNILQKKWHLPSQTSLDREERELNVYGAFKISHAGKIRGKNILLIDDVLTTGATAKEAARTLKEAGARRVDLFALARTVTGAEKNTLRFHTIADSIVNS